MGREAIGARSFRHGNSLGTRGLGNDRGFRKDAAIATVGGVAQRTVDVGGEAVIEMANVVRRCQRRGQRKPEEEEPPQNRA